jgi:hypothetical protein
MINYNANSTLHGGHLSDIPLPRIRRWPGCPDKRKITIRITRYYDVGIHYFLTIFEEDNPLWNEKNQEWQFAWDDKEYRGKTDFDFLIKLLPKTRFDAYEEALGWANIILREFPDHEVVWEDYCKDWEDEKN